MRVFRQLKSTAIASATAKPSQPPQEMVPRNALDSVRAPLELVDSLSCAQSQRWLPCRSTSTKLFVTGATVGPVVDSLHNQCLLQYHFAPITVDLPFLATAPTAAISSSLPNLLGSTVLDTSQLHQQHLFCSSWTVFPLLGIAYVVLGGVLPRVMQRLVDTMSSVLKRRSDHMSLSIKTTTNTIDQRALQKKAVLAVVTTAMIIKASDYLQRNGVADVPIDLDWLTAISSSNPSDQYVLILIFAAMMQWLWLDGTTAALLAASITAFGGPLSELPFVASGIWTYLPQAGDYLPLQGLSDDSFSWLFANLLGSNYNDLALSSITGPCYFAVTMDAIALGRYFDSKRDT